MVSTTKRVKVVTAIALPAALLMACGDDSGDDEYTAYCVNKDNQVVDEHQCDEMQRGGGGGGGGSDGFFFMMLPYGSPYYGGGSYIPNDRGYSRVSSNDAAGRERVGLPKSGTVKSGTKVGGLGKGSPGGSMKGGGS